MALDQAVLVDDQGPGADQRHVAAQDVQQLGKLVERGAPQEAADAGDAGVVLDLEEATAGLVAVGELRALGVGAVDHGAELVDLEDLGRCGRPGAGGRRPGRASRA